MPEEIDKPAVRASIIVPAFNVEAWLGQCLDSLIEQTCPNFEIIVIDDGSTDSTPAIIERYARVDSRIKAMSQENRGLSAVRNSGMQIAKGEVLFFIDSDDWLHREAVAQVLQLFEQHEPDLVIYQCAKFNDSNQSWSSGTDDYYWDLISSRASGCVRAHEVPEMLALYPLAQLKAISRRFVHRHQVSFIEGLRYEDNPLHPRIFSLNPSIAFLRRKLYAWRQGRPGQITAKPHISDCQAAIREMLRVGNSLEPRALIYLLVAMTRLVASVARLVAADSERRDVLADFRQRIREGLGSGSFERAFAAVLQSRGTHPGDLLIVRGLFTNPEHLASALGGGPGRHIGALRCLTDSNPEQRRWPILAGLTLAAKNGRLLYHYAQGRGESSVAGFTGIK